MLAALLTTVLFSVSAVSARRSTRYLGGTSANFWRLLFATILLALWAHLLGGGVASAGFWFFFLSGCIGFGVGDLALFQALPRLGSRLTILLVQCLAAPIGALLEWVWLGTSLSMAEILSGCTILAGVAVAVSPSEHVHLPKRILVAGLLFGLLAAFGQGFGAVVSRKAYEVDLAGGGNIDGITAAYQRILGGILVSGVGLILVKRFCPPPAVADGPGDYLPAGRSEGGWRAAWPWVLLNGLAGPALGVSCYQWALKTTPTGLVLSIVATTPLVIIPFSRLMEGDRLERRSILGGLIAVVGAVALALVKHS